MTTHNSHNSASFAKGDVLKIKTKLGEDIEGQVLIYDDATEIVVLHPIKKGFRRNLRLLKRSFIDNYVLERNEDTNLELQDLLLDISKLVAREDTAVKQAEDEAQRIGHGVTPEAQSIFDFFYKTMPVRWDGDVIVVMNEVRISSPYLLSNVEGGADAANHRVKKILEIANPAIKKPAN